MTGVHAVVLPAPGSGAEASSKFSAPSPLCRMSSRSPATSTSYSTPWRRGVTTENSLAGAAACSSHTSLVSLDEVWIISHFSSRDVPTPSQNFSSLSSNTTMSSDVGVPTMCRHTRYGRHVSSTVT